MIKKYNFDSDVLTRKQQEEWEDSIKVSKDVFETAKQRITNGTESYISEKDYTM